MSEAKTIVSVHWRDPQQESLTTTASEIAADSRSTREEVEALKQTLAAGRSTKRSGQLQEAIASIIKDVPRGVHLTAPEVYRRARELGLAVSLSTVYRTLNLLQAGGNVSTLAGDHGRRYEARDSDHDHDHIICLKCGLTIEFTDELIRGFGKAVAERKGYVHTSSRFDILGICSDCKARDEDNKVSSAIASVENAVAALQESAAKLESCLTLLEARKLTKALEALNSSLTPISEALSESQNALDTLQQPAHPVAK